MSQWDKAFTPPLLRRSSVVPTSSNPEYCINLVSQDTTEIAAASPSSKPASKGSTDSGLKPSRKARRRIERETKLKKDSVAVELLIEEAHKKLPLSEAKSFGVIYARYSSDFQHSIQDQIRELIEYAVANGIYVRREHIYWDSGVSGRKVNRPGLDQARAALATDQVNVLLVFSSNRLYRKGYQCMKFTVEDVVGEGKRAVFLKNNIDTSESDFWMLLLPLMSFIDEIVTRMTIPNIHAAHTGMLLKEMVFGAVTYGYDGEIVPGEFRRNGAPRRRLIINEDEARWVREVFRWYVIDRLTIRAIVKLLNANPEIPPPRTNAKGCWTRGTVIHLLSNSRYRGWWVYGRFINVWNSKKDCSRAVLRDEPLKSIQIDRLRVVDDDIWYAAQSMLIEQKKK
ncbi:MAG: recombinase family protein, partial [Gemmatales bacterium]